MATAVEKEAQLSSTANTVTDDYAAVAPVADLALIDHYFTNFSHETEACAEHAIQDLNHIKKNIESHYLNPDWMATQHAFSRTIEWNKTPFSLRVRGAVPLDIDYVLEASNAAWAGWVNRYARAATVYVERTVQLRIKYEAALQAAKGDQERINAIYEKWAFAFTNLATPLSMCKFPSGLIGDRIIVEKNTIVEDDKGGVDAVVDAAVQGRDWTHGTIASIPADRVNSFAKALCGTIDVMEAVVRTINEAALEFPEPGDRFFDHDLHSPLEEVPAGDSLRTLQEAYSNVPKTVIAPLQLLGTHLLTYFADGTAWLDETFLRYDNQTSLADAMGAVANDLDENLSALHEIKIVLDDSTQTAAVLESAISSLISNESLLTPYQVQMLSITASKVGVTMPHQSLGMGLEAYQGPRGRSLLTIATESFKSRLQEILQLIKAQYLRLKAFIAHVVTHLWTRFADLMLRHRRKDKALGKETDSVATTLSPREEALYLHIAQELWVDGKIDPELLMQRLKKLLLGLPAYTATLDHDVVATGKIVTDFTPNGQYNTANFIKRLWKLNGKNEIPAPIPMGFERVDELTHATKPLRRGEVLAIHTLKFPHNGKHADKLHAIAYGYHLSVTNLDEIPVIQASAAVDTLRAMGPRIVAVAKEMDEFFDRESPRIRDSLKVLETISYLDFFEEVIAKEGTPPEKDEWHNDSEVIMAAAHYMHSLGVVGASIVGHLLREQTLLAMSLWRFEEMEKSYHAAR